MSVYTDEIFGPVLSVCPRRDLRRGARSGQLQPLRQRHGDLHQRRRCGPALPERGGGRHGRHQRADPGAGGLLQLRRLEGVAVRRHPRPRHRGRALLHPRQGHHHPLAGSQPRRHRARLPRRTSNLTASVRVCSRHAVTWHANTHTCLTRSQNEQKGSLRLVAGMVGGGDGADIGKTHRHAMRLDDQYVLAAGVLGRTPTASAQIAQAPRRAPDRVYRDYLRDGRSRSRARGRRRRRHRGHPERQPFRDRKRIPAQRESPWYARSR